ncbi:MAG: hypothetical protein ACYCSN_15420 [Acidobacteriaceae bacterium]
MAKWETGVTTAWGGALLGTYAPNATIPPGPRNYIKLRFQSVFGGVDFTREIERGHNLFVANPSPYVSYSAQVQPQTNVNAPATPPPVRFAPKVGLKYIAKQASQASPARLAQLAGSGG